ncbi:tetratricopeptide repeat protein [Luminiphilus sp.]|nr:tetratricopeptide repeat protein [Luminiphilus sp.]MDA8678389.1 tetratricopeptide repeat protein [Luminiphilus sp.]
MKTSGDAPSFDELLDNAIEHYESGRLENAKEVAVSLSQKFPNQQVGWKVLGVMLQKLGETRESLVPMQRSAELGPLDAEAHYNLGVTLWELGHLSEAEESYKQALALKFDYAEAHSNLGATLQELGRLDEAEKSYLQAIRLMPDDFRAHNYLGAVRTELGKLAEAETSCKRSLALQSDYAEAHNNLGLSLERQGKLVEAKGSYESAIELKMGFNLAQDNLASTLRKLGKLEEAADRENRIKYLCSTEDNQDRPQKPSSISMFTRPSPLEYSTLYRPGMGTENVGSFLRAMVQILRPKTVLEVGAGYTTPFLLEGIVNNERVFDDGNLQESYFEDYTYEAKLVVIDDMSLGELADRPGMKEIISSPYTEFIEGSFEGRATALQQKYNHFDFVWFDCGGLAEYKSFVEDYWDICSGYIFFHFTYTLGNPNELHETVVSSLNSNTVFFDIVEPHKSRQGSITMVRKDG